MNTILVDNACALVMFVLDQDKNYNNNCFAAQLQRSFPEVDFDLLKQAVRKGRELAVQKRTADWEERKNGKTVEQKKEPVVDIARLVEVSPEEAERRRHVALEIQNKAKEKKYMEENFLDAHEFLNLKWQACLNILLDGQELNGEVIVGGEAFLVSPKMAENARIRFQEIKERADKFAERGAAAAEARMKAREKTINVPLSKTQLRKMNRQRKKAA